MPGITSRTGLFIQGPALVTYRSQTFYHKGNITVKFLPKMMPIPADGLGEIDSRPIDRGLEVSFESIGAWSAAIAAVLWPHLALLPDQSIVGATDYPLVIWGRDNDKLTIHNAFVSKMPPLRVAVDKTASGATTFRGILRTGYDPSDAAAYYTRVTATYPGDSTLATSGIIHLPGTAVWGASAPWSSFRTESGWEFDFAMATKDKTIDGFGTVDVIMTSLTATAKAVPAGVTMADIMAKLPMAGALGTTTAGEADLVISTATGGPQVTLNAARLTDGPIAFGADTNRVGQCTWQATRTWTAGVPDALAVVAAQSA